ncbi:APC family permease [Actinospica durhamensis]|uniref:APC family permease n=1 Tax=Actinospica durhamensis TaxID=1508375 RepID=A0A941ESH9_9ACTN|nr:APC family permease [Actinospica durhamensis]MBR7837590.1 APC family permease [Actinospica durhamensis]
MTDSLTSGSTGSPAPSGIALKREIGLIGLTWSSMGSIIGSGWLFGALFAAQAAGTAALLSWGIGVTAIVILAFVHAELGGAYPVAGGTGRFPHYAYGSVAGASFGWFSYLQAVTVAPIEVYAAISYASVHLGWLQHSDGTLTWQGLLIAIGLMALFTVVNFLGVRRLANTNSAATWWKIAIPTLVIIVFAATHFHGSNFGVDGFAPTGAEGVLSAVSTGGIMFALLGFEQADQLAGESRNPQHDIPRAVLGSVLLGAVIYIMLQVVFIAALPHTAFAHGWANLSFPGDAGPFAGLATLLGLGWLGTILYIDAIVSPSGTGLIYTTASSRVSYGLSRNGYVPNLFEKTNERRVPWFGLLVAFLIGCIAFLPFPTWKSLVGFITSASVLMYAGAPLAFGALRLQDRERYRPFRLAAGDFWAPVAFVVSGLIIYWSGWDTLQKLGYAIVLGYAIIGANFLFKLNPHLPHPDWRAAQWLPVYLIGMGVLSWQGRYCSKGPATTTSCGATDAVPEWWDLGIIAVFSLVIYYWALAVRLPDAEAHEYIGDVNAQIGATAEAA